MIGSFHFHPIGGKGRQTEPVNACFPHLAPHETSTLAFWLARVIFTQWALFAAERSRGTKSPNWRANDALGHVKQRKFKFGGFV